MGNNNRADGLGPALRVIAIMAAIGAVVLGWFFFARSGEERVSSSGFRDSSTVFAERRAQTDLNFVGHPASPPPPSAKMESSPAPFVGAAAPEAAPAAAPTYGSTPPAPGAGAPRPPADMADEADAGKLAALGVPTDKAALANLANQRGPMGRLFNKVLSYPKVVRFLLNNHVVVDTLFSREAAQRTCGSSSYLTSYLADGGNPKGVSEEVPVVRALMQNPESAMEAVNSEFGRRIMACPSIAQLQKNPDGLAQAMIANPELLSIIADPAAASALSVNAHASALFNEGQADISGGAAGR